MRPSTLGEALELLHYHGDEARPLAGGQSLVPMMNLRMARPSMLVDLNVVPELSGIALQSDFLRVGAMTRQAVILDDAQVRQHAPLVVVALKHVGHFQTRSRGTIGGSLAHADPSAELALAMVTLNARLRLQSVNGERVIEAHEFFIDAMTTAIGAGEIITEIMIPRSPPDAKVVFREYARREGDFAIVSTAVQRSAGESSLLVAVGGVASVPFFCSELSRRFSRSGFDTAIATDLARAELERIEPMSDLNADGAYRRHVASIFLLESLREVFA
ncbi:FAD binding domain-containing protein [Bradyrhizobium sp. NP1]|uniref:FAD binding domain-containing protein n=1 Tax=Bradyrhizobium sp. NP1 TaxID=3049772 RepID=UPI0025A4F678|nr:FAD binding domain-containing protein [Bradyrhizobium sp. NP1]WJR81896.1 FAD binding domain-containing protein [Bradyrhizobium sp. NP1]